MDETQQVPNQNSITPAPPVTTYPTPQPVPSSKTPWLVIVIVLLVGIASYFGYQTYQLKQQLTVQQPSTTSETTLINSPTPTSTSTSTATTDPTSNWQVHVIKELGISFKYPPNLQPMDYPRGIETKGEKGTQLCLSFIPFETSLQLIKPVHAGGGACQGIFAIASTSTDYEAGREGGFGDIQGYIKTGNNFTANFVLGKQYDLPLEQVREITNPQGIKILVIVGKNTTQYVERGPEPIPGTPGDGYLGAIVNVKKNGYSGFNIQMKLSPKLTSETFDQILSTLQLTQ